MHDVPYLMPQSVGPELVSSCSVVCREMRREFNNLPLGLQLLAACNKEALAVAAVTGMH